MSNEKPSTSSSPASTKNATEKAAANPNPFNPESLRITQDFAAAEGAQTLFNRIPVRKPDRQEWFRVHPGEDMRLDMAVVELKEEREIFVLTPNVAQELPGEWFPVRMFVCVNRQQKAFLWPCKLPRESAKLGRDAAESALETAAEGMVRWVNMRWDGHIKAYATRVPAPGIQLPEPIWPPQSLPKLLEVGVGKNLVDSMEHPLILRLNGG